MLNKNGKRELAYSVRVNNITSMEGYDSLELAHINGWTCVVGKGEMKTGDLAIYFEIDSKLPETEPFVSSPAIVKYKFRIKTQRFARGGVPYYSQGLLMPLASFANLKINEEGVFLTDKLNITYYEPEDNKRKADLSKYTSMQARHKKFFKTKFGKWIMKHEWGRKLMFFFLGKKKDKKIDWPNWVVKTDEERVQNLPNLFKDDVGSVWVATEKIDGSSTTFTMKQAKPKKRKLLVCSRNVVFDSPKKESKNYYKDTCGNIYLDMAQKYDIEKVLNDILDNNPSFEYITIQGETYGANVQKRDYSLSDRDFRVFNIIYKKKNEAPVRMATVDMAYFLAIYSGAKCLKTVPIVSDHYVLPDSCDRVVAAAAGISKIDGKMREGLVFRSPDGVRSFKAVDPEFLLKYHNN